MCAVGIWNTCDVSHECRFRLRVESNYVPSCRVCVFASCCCCCWISGLPFFLLLLFCFYFQCTYKCMNGWMECEWEVKQVLFFGVVVWFGWFGWLEWKKREMKNDMGVSSRARMCLCSMVSKKKRNFWLTIHFALTFLWLGFFSLFLSSYRKRLS